MNLPRLQTPADETPAERAIELCHAIIAEGVETRLAIAGVPGATRGRRSYLGDEYDEAYAQGRKDAARAILITLGEMSLGQTSDRRRSELPQAPDEEPHGGLIVPPDEDAP